MTSRSPSRDSRSQDRSRSPPSDSRSRSHSRTRPQSRNGHVRRNGRHHSSSRSRSRSQSRSESRDRSPSRGRSVTRSRSRSRSRLPAPRSTKIVVEKLTRNTNQGHIQEIFGQYGEILDLDVPLHRGFNFIRGNAFIVYATTQAAENAIASMHEGQIDGSTISVSIVQPKYRFSPSPSRAAAPPPREYRSGPRYEPYSSSSGPPVHNRRPSGPQGHGASPPLGSRSREDVYVHPSRQARIRSRSPGPTRGGYGGGAQRQQSNTYYRRRTPSRSRSPPPRRYTRERTRSRSRSYDSRYSRASNRAPARRGGGGGSGVGGDRRDQLSPPRRGAGGGSRRSPSYNSYSDTSSRSRSRERTGGGGRRR